MKRNMMFIICALVVLLMGTVVSADAIMLSPKGKNTFYYSAEDKKHGCAVCASETFYKPYDKGKLKNIKVKVSDPSVLKYVIFDDDKLSGMMYPKKLGKATITYTAYNGSKKIKEVYHINFVKRKKKG